MAQMTATQAARQFSDVLNRVAAGEELEVTRSGAAVALITPPRTRLISSGRLRELIDGAPDPDSQFAEDLRDLRRGVEPPGEPWPS